MTFLSNCRSRLSSMDELFFYILSIVFYVLVILAYCKFIYLPVFNSALVSVALLMLMVLCSNFLSDKLPCSENDIVNTAFYTIGSLGIYTAISYFSLYQKTLTVLGIILSVISIGLIILIFVLFRGSGVSFKNKLCVTAVTFVIVLGFISTALLSIISYNNLHYGKGVLPSSALSYYTGDLTDLDEDQAILEINFDLLADDYSEWTLEEKISLCQKIVNFECENLSIDPARVFTADLNQDVPEGYTLLGFYNAETNRIFIDCSTLATLSGEQILETLLHENFHAFQHYLIDLYENNAEVLIDYPELFERAQIYSSEAEHYISELSSYDSYSNQLIEADARAYATYRAEDYLFHLGEAI